MAKRRILIAEDDAHIRRGLADALESEGYAVFLAGDGRETLARVAKDKPDLILLDIMMPEKNGYDVCRELRQAGHTVPIVMLTAKGEELDKVLGLQLGADDYVAKPFGVSELLARIAAVLRRTRIPTPASERQPSPSPARFRFGAADIERKTYRARKGRKSYALTARELKLIEVFRAHPDEVMSRDDLLNAVWGVEYYGTTRTLDQHIAQLRKKIEQNPGQPACLLTVHGVGYRYRP